jgi:hypothetical protein
VPSDQRPDGVYTMPYYELSPQARELLRAVPIEIFDWGAWLTTEEGRRLSTDKAALAEANVDQLIRLLTAIVRSDRFSEGSLAGAFESGLLEAIVRRAAALTQDVADEEARSSD